MQSYSPKPSGSYKVPIEIDADLVDWVDQLISDGISDAGQSIAPSPVSSTDRTRIIEEAIRSWCQQQTQRRLQRSADLHRQRHENDETGWLV